MILVTGATGFVGSELCRQLLQHGKKVRAIRRKSSVIPPLLVDQPVEWVEGDMLNYFSLEDALENVQEVYHCAAVVSFDPSDKKMMHRINVEGTANLVNLCIENNIDLLHVSSVAAIGDAKDNQLATERNYYEYSDFHSAYSISKYESEMEVWRGIAEGLKAVIVNPSIIIGKNAGSRGSGQLFETVRSGLRFYPEGSCGFVDVADVAEAMIKLMDNGIRSERFILNAENWLYKDLFTKIATCFGLKPPSVRLKTWHLEIAWKTLAIVSIITGKRFGITRETAKSASKRQDYSNQKIKSTIDINFTPIDELISEICTARQNAK